MSEPTLDSARRFAIKLSKADLQTLSDTCSGLKTRNSFKETKKEWLNRYRPRIFNCKSYTEMIESHVGLCQKKSGDPKKIIRKAFANAIRKRQVDDLGIDKYLTNEVHLSIFRTLVNYFNNPVKLKN